MSCEEGLPWFEGKTAYVGMLPLFSPLQDRVQLQDGFLVVGKAGEEFKHATSDFSMHELL